MKQILLIVVFICLYGSFFTEEALLSAEININESSVKDSLAAAPLVTSSVKVSQNNRQLGLWQYD